MAKLGDIIKISDADYTALKNAGSAGYVINGVRYYYSENNIYLTPSNGGGGGGGGTATDVQINGTSITSNNVANILTNSSYSSSNKIATMNDVDNIVANPANAYNILKTIGINGTNYKIKPTLYHNNIQIQFNTGSDRGTLTISFDNHENYQTTFDSFISEGSSSVNALWYILQNYSNVASSSNNFGGITAGGAFYSNYYSKLCVIVKMYMTSTQMAIEYVNCSDGSYGQITINKSNTSYFTSVSVKSVEIKISYGE